MHTAISQQLVEILACPICKGDVRLEGEKLVCTKCGRRFPIIDGIPIMLGGKLSEDLKLSQERWDQEYRKRYNLEDINLSRDLELKGSYFHVKNILRKHIRPKEGYFLEIGSGPAKISYLLAKEGIKTVGIDFSLNALRLGKNLFEKEGVMGLFVCGNILEMPFKKNIFQFSYGGGVIEHFKDTQEAVNEIYRVTAAGGFTTNTVPYLSLSTIYRVLRWGNIPDIPGIREATEFFEITLFDGKFMRFGYEKSFTLSKIRKIFRKAGFKNIQIGLFRTYYPLEVISSSVMKEAISKIANSSRLFWPMIYVNGEKK